MGPMHIPAPGNKGGLRNGSETRNKFNSDMKGIGKGPTQDSKCTSTNQSRDSPRASRPKSRQYCHQNKLTDCFFFSPQGGPGHFTGLTFPSSGHSRKYHTRSLSKQFPLHPARLGPTLIHDLTPGLETAGRGDDEKRNNK